MGGRSRDAGVVAADPEEVREVSIPRSLSMRQVFALFLVLYFGATGSLFFVVQMEHVQSAMIKGEPPANETEHLGPIPAENASHPSHTDLLAKRSEQVKLETEEVFVARGDDPQISWVGDRYAVLFSRGGWSDNGSTLYVTYSVDCLNWSEPVEVAGMPPGLAISGGIKGSLIGAANGSLILICGRSYEGDNEARLFASTSDDGVVWSGPRILPAGSMRILDLYGISIAQAVDGSYTIAFSGDLFLEGTSNGSADYWESGEMVSAVATMSSDDGVSWAEPAFAKTPPDHQYPVRHLYTWGRPCVAEKEGILYVAHADFNGDVWSGPRTEDGWEIVQASPDGYFSYLGAVSMVHLANGSTILAFDCLKHIYLMGSNDTVSWNKPLWVASGEMPSIAPVGKDSLLVTYVGGGGIYVKLVSSPPAEEPEESGAFEIAFPQEGSDLFSNETFSMVHNASKASASIAGWTDERYDVMVFDSAPASFTLFRESREGWIPRLRKYTQSTGMVVWRLSLKYLQGLDGDEIRVNIYAGGTFGSDSTWEYSEEEDLWVVRFDSAMYEILGGGDILETGTMEFTMSVRRIPG